MATLSFNCIGSPSGSRFEINAFLGSILNPILNPSFELCTKTMIAYPTGRDSPAKGLFLRSIFGPIFGASFFARNQARLTASPGQPAESISQ
jgi:hypothetical protein